MNSPAEPPRSGFRTMLFMLIGVAVVLALITGGVLGLMLLRSPRAPQTAVQAPAPEATVEVAPVVALELASEEKDFSQTNIVMIRLGEESPEDGLRHLAEERDGRTTVTNLEGVVCRHMQRPERGNGFLYFVISPSFKAAGLTNARCEIEYFTTRPLTLRLQYDAMDGERHRPYRSVQAVEGLSINYNNSDQISRVLPSKSWQVATFHLRDGVFQNSQNGGADLRLEVKPPDIFVRRVTITRESGPRTQ